MDDDTEALSHETLLAGSTVRMFGRLFEGLSVNPDRLGSREFRDRKNPKLARIYGFSWQGNYFKMAAPAVFLVFGDGTPIPEDMKGATIGQIGIEFKDEFFAKDVLMWAGYDVDYTVRIDITGGWLSEILIGAEASDASNMTGSGDGNDGPGRVTARQALAARQAFVTRPRNS